MTRASLTKCETRSVRVQSFRTEILSISPFWAFQCGRLLKNRLNSPKNQGLGNFQTLRFLLVEPSAPYLTKKISTPKCPHLRRYRGAKVEL